MSYKDDLGVKIATYSGEQMVALAYEALIENLEEASKLIKTGNKEEVSKLINHNKEIFAHLTATMGEEEDEVSFTTKQIYLYVNRLMTEGFNKIRPELFEEGAKVLTPLKDGWHELSMELEKIENEKDVKSSGNTKKVYAGATYGKQDINIYSDSQNWDKG